MVLERSMGPLPVLSLQQPGDESVADMRFGVDFVTARVDDPA